MKPKLQYVISAAVTLLVILAFAAALFVYADFFNNGGKQSVPAASDVVMAAPKTDAPLMLSAPAPGNALNADGAVQSEPSAAVEPSETPVPAPRTVKVKISVVGDLMVHTDQLTDAASKAQAPDEYDFSGEFEYISKYIKSADYAIGNLETVLGGKDAVYSDYPMFNSPDEYAQAIKDAGFDFLTTANNHCNDRGESGILRTINALDGLGIDHTGTYASQESRDTIFIKNIKGIRFAILSYTYGTNGLPLADGKPYLANVLSEELVKKDIESAKALNPDFIIVLAHMGDEYAPAPSDTVTAYFKMMFEAGADIILASHPHVLQKTEYYDITDPDGTTRHCFAAYSLGNFLSSQRTEPRDAGAILNLYFEKTENEKAVLKDVSFIPTWVKFYDAQSRLDISVVSVYDELTGAPAPELRSADFNRIERVQTETTDTLAGEPTAPENAKAEYIIPDT